MNEKFLLDQKNTKEYLDLVSRIRAENTAYNPSRREFLKQAGLITGGLGTGIILGAGCACKQHKSPF